MTENIVTTEIPLLRRRNSRVPRNLAPENVSVVLDLLFDLGCSTPHVGHRLCFGTSHREIIISVPRVTRLLRRRSDNGADLSFRRGGRCSLWFLQYIVVGLAGGGSICRTTYVHDFLLSQISEGLLVYSMMFIVNNIRSEQKGTRIEARKK
jgi:hypothetical protein